MEEMFLAIAHHNQTIKKAAVNMKRIYRSKKESVLAGVCGGIAEHFLVDPVIVRLIWLGLILFGTMGIPLYIIAWVIIPLNREASLNTAEYAKRSPSSYKPLLRAREDRMIAGLCGGLGKYFDKDPVFFRILVLILLFPFGIGFWIYIFGIVLIPSEA